MTKSYVLRSRERLRAEILSAAGDEVMANGWRGLRMQAVADRAGVSRQTVNNEFDSKTGLAQALVLDVGARYCDLHEKLLAACPDITTALRATIRSGLEHAASDQAFKTVLTPDGSDTFLPLYTNQAQPLLDLFATRLTAAWLRRWPELDPDLLRIANDACGRLTLSHVLLPTRPAEQVAEEFVALFAPFLAACDPSAREGDGHRPPGGGR